MKNRRSLRGVTFIEVMASGVVLIIGLMAAAMLVTQTSRQNRRTLTQTQAQIIAERELERISALGCKPVWVAAPCENIRLLDRTEYSVWQTANGGLQDVAPAAGAPVAREYLVQVDVDPPAEEGELGEPSLSRELGGGLAGNQHNVRVAVSWLEPSETQRRVVVLQTRMAP